MPTVAQLNSRYARADDAELQELLAAGPEHLTPEAWAALIAETGRRRLSSANQTEDADPTFTAAEVRLSGKAVTYPKAPLGPRVVAYFLDLLVGLGPLLVGVSLYSWTGAGKGLWTIVVALPFLAAMTWALYYSFNKDGRTGGQSVGKGAMGLMVVSIETNQPCSAGQSAVRALLFLLAAVPLAGWLIEPIAIIATEDGRRVGDRLAGTQVITVDAYRPNT